MRLVQSDEPGCLDGQQREAVGRCFIGAALAADDDAVVVLVGVGVHEPPLRAQKIQRSRLGHSTGIQVAGEEGAQRDIEPPVVPGAGMDGPEPEELQCFPERARRLVPDGAQDFPQIVRGLWLRRIEVDG